MGMFMMLMIDGLAFCAAMLAVPGLSAPNGVLHFLIAAVLFGIVSAAVRPVLWVLSCPLIFITLPPMIVLLHAFTLWINSWLTGFLGVSVAVGGFLPAMFGAVVISVVRMAAMNALLYYKRRQAFSKNRADLQQLQRTKEWLERQCDHWKRLIEEGDLRIQEDSDRINPSGENRRRGENGPVGYVVGSENRGAPDMRHRRLDHHECRSGNSAGVGMCPDTEHGPVPSRPATRSSPSTKTP